VRKHCSYLIIALLCLTLLAASCAPARRPLPDATPADPLPTPNAQTVPAPNQPTNSSVNMEIDRLELAVEQIAGVERANIALVNNAALCGVKTADGVNPDRANTIRQDIEKVVREVKPDIGSITIAVEDDLLPRIKQLAQDIKGGKPTQGLTGEMNEIISRLNPKTNQ